MTFKGIVWINVTCRGRSFIITLCLAQARRKRTFFSKLCRFLNVSFEVLILLGIRRLVVKHQKLSRTPWIKVRLWLKVVVVSQKVLEVFKRCSIIPRVRCCSLRLKAYSLLLETQVYFAPLLWCQSLVAFTRGKGQYDFSLFCFCLVYSCCWLSGAWHDIFWIRC